LRKKNVFNREVAGPPPHANLREVGQNFEQEIAEVTEDGQSEKRCRHFVLPPQSKFVDGLTFQLETFGRHHVWQCAARWDSVPYLNRVFHGWKIGFAFKIIIF
jgi:hypothetical protein